MFRGNMDEKKFIAPKVDSWDFASCPRGKNVSDKFWGFVAHEYKDYTYYTGSDFPADKKTQAIIAYTDFDLLIYASMEDPVMQQAVENLKNNKLDFFMADHLTVNIITPTLNRFLFAVNPLGERTTEMNLEKDVSLAFDAKINIKKNAWDVLFKIPFASLGIKDPDNCVLGFDIVRQEQGDASITTLTRTEVTPPYNYIYEYPIFHFSALYLGNKTKPAEGLFENATEGTFAKVISKTKIVVDTFCEVVLEITIGKNGLTPGGRIRLSHGAPVLNCGAPWTVPLDWQNVQSTNPKASGCLSIEGANFDIKTNGIHTEATYKATKALPPGATLTIRIGDTRYGGPGIRSSLITCDKHPIKINLDPLARGIFEPLSNWPELKLISGNPADIIISNPGAVPAGTPFELCIRVVNHIGNMVEHFTGKIRLFLDAHDHTFPEEIIFDKNDKGVKLIEGAIKDKGIFSFSAAYKMLSGQSNFIATDGSFGEGCILYGDIHCHTSTSDGYRSPADKVYESRSLRGLNFMAIADHDFDQSPEKWQHYKTLASQADQPGKFICYLAHEWTPTAGHGKPFHRQMTGHYVILYPTFEGDLIRANDQSSNTPEKLFAQAHKQTDLMLIPHYHGLRPPIEPEISYALEIVAWDGKFAENENEAKHSVFSTLNEGYRLGLIAGTDHGGEGLTVYRNGEMFAVQVDKFDRDAIREGIKKRKTVAITHTRILLNFSMNGCDMGSEVTLPGTQERKFRIKVASRPCPTNILLIRNGEVISSFDNAANGEQNIVEFNFIDHEPFEGEAWYMAKVILHGGEPIWSSPIWAITT